MTSSLTNIDSRYPKSSCNQCKYSDQESNQTSDQNVALTQRTCIYLIFCQGLCNGHDTTCKQPFDVWTSQEGLNVWREAEGDRLMMPKFLRVLQKG